MRFLKFIYGPGNPTNKVLSETEIECFCSSDSGFFVTSRQASYISAAIIFLFIATFVTGYFWGKKSAIHEFGNNVLNGSFADQAKYSFYSLYGSPVEEEDSDEDEAQPHDDEIEKAKVEIINPPVPIITLKEDQIITKDVNTINPKKYQALLVGFNSLESAQQFVNKNQKKGYNLQIKKRNSVTSKRKSTKYWYQVVTDEFDDKSKLIDLVDKIKASERLHDVKIVANN